MDNEFIQPPNEGQKPGNHGKEAKNAVPISPPNVSIEKTTADPEAAKADSQKRKRKRLSCFELWTIILGGIAILVAAATGIAIYWQDKIASQSLTEIHKQYPPLRDAADAAKRAADTAHDALIDSQESFRIEERPYLWAYPAAGPNNVVLPTKGEKIFVRVDFKNSGKTPETPGAVIPPEITASVRTGYGPELTETILGGLQHGTWEMYVVGAIKYTDIFQPSIAPYETTYCFSFSPTGLPFGNCQWGGDSIK